MALMQINLEKFLLFFKLSTLPLILVYHLLKNGPLIMNLLLKYLCLINLSQDQSLHYLQHFVPALGQVIE